MKQYWLDTVVAVIVIAAVAVGAAFLGFIANEYDLVSIPFVQAEPVQAELEEEEEQGWYSKELKLGYEPARSWHEAYYYTIWPGEEDSETPVRWSFNDETLRKYMEMGWEKFWSFEWMLEYMGD